jgi:3-dehydroquinate dehydratase-2
MPMKVLVLNGVNLDMLGQRDPAHYGRHTLADIEAMIRALATQLGVEVTCFQTNHEGAMCERLHQARGEKPDAVLINAGAWTHYSYAIRDALELVEAPVYEVHLSDISKREPFRRHSVFEGLARATVSGLGHESYLEALRMAVRTHQ